MSTDKLRDAALHGESLASAQVQLTAAMERLSPETVSTKELISIAQINALIAQVEATRAQNAILERIAVVLEGVYDPKVEMLRVEAWNYDTRRELG